MNALYRILGLLVFLLLLSCNRGGGDRFVLDNDDDFIFAPPNTQVYSSGIVDELVDGVFFASSDISVPNLGIVQGLRVRVNILHTFIGELDILLESPNSTIIELSTGNGEDGIDMAVIFSDASSFSIVNDFEGSFDEPAFLEFRPEDPLSTFNGQTAQGTWTLTVMDDNFNADDGFLNEWALLFP
jgi:subtilisin-like proprotein convertase family protein